MNKIHRFDKLNNDLIPPHSFPDPYIEQPQHLAKLAAKECINYLEDINNWTESSEYLSLKEHKRIGKMFGVLVVQDKKEQLGFIAAFSGKLLGKNNYNYFIPPIFDMLEKEGHYCKEEAELFGLNTEIHNKNENLIQIKRTSQIYYNIKELERQIIGLKKSLRQQKDGRNQLKNEIISLEKKKQKISIPSEIIHLENTINHLKEERKNKSKVLQNWLFNQYNFLNNNGESKDLKAIFHGNTIPSGSGECAAPKLLQFAYKNNLNPICMAEFWWGKSTNSEDKKQGEFYPPCSEKCKFILNHMLKGLIL